MTVIIGIDPHKATHTAVAISCNEQELAEIKVRATGQQTAQLLAWAEPLGPRTWAVESAGGLGYLLSQQLVEAGEHVLDVPATLASRVRVLGTGRSNKNDPNDARSVAVAALRSLGLRSVVPADHGEVLRLLAKRNHEIGRLRNIVVSRLHAALLNLSPGGISKELIGYTGDVRRFTSRDQYASYAGVAPIELSSGGRIVHRLSRRGNRQLNHAIHLVAICQIRQTDSAGRVYFERRVAEGKTKREAIRSLKRHVSNSVYRQLLIDAQK